MSIRVWIAFAAATICAGCVTTEPVAFQPGINQQLVVRDGDPGIVSTQKNSIVIVRPAARQLRIGGRPVFVVAIYNRTNKPENFEVSDIKVTQLVHGTAVPLKVITYQQLVNEEKTRQVFAAIGAGLAVAGNSMAAANAGYYHSNSTIFTPSGPYSMYTTGYSPGAAAIAQANANAENSALIGQTIARGQANMAYLGRTVLKDDTLMPGEWYGGQLYLQPLSTEGGPMKTYSMDITVGTDHHDITVDQGRAQS